MEEIKNSKLCLHVSCRGAEIQSLKSIETGKEYMWQGDTKFWNRRSPLLFPIVGGMWNGTTRFGQDTYKIPKHGFLQDHSFNLAEQTPNSLRYICQATAAQKEVFPFDYTLEVIYTLDEQTLHVEYRVENTNSETLHFQIGGHPGFNIPNYNAKELVHGFVKFEGKPESLLRASTQGCLEPQRLPYDCCDNEGWVELKEGLFAHDALIFDEHQVTSVLLADKNRQPFARVTTPSAVTLMWAPDGINAPFVCVEPWYGLCDYQGFEGSFSERPYVNEVLPEQIWKGGYDIQIL